MILKYLFRYQLIEFKDDKEKQLLFQLIDLKINYKNLHCILNLE